MNGNEISELVKRHEELKAELRGIEHQLVEIVLNSKLSLAQALEERLIRLNFPAPSGFYRHMDRTRTKR